MSVKGLFADLRDYLSMRPEDEVRAFVSGFDWFLNERNLRPESVPGTDYLEKTIELTAAAERYLATSLLAQTSMLHWKNQFSAKEFGEDIFTGCGLVEIFGPNGHFDSSAMAAGFLVLGPNRIMKGHKYASEQLYIPLTGGAFWMQDFGAFEEKPASSPILVESNEIHAIQTKEVPLLALRVWCGNDLTQSPTI